jgi:hypothetical protein
MTLAIFAAFDDTEPQGDSESYGESNNRSPRYNG